MSQYKLSPRRKTALKLKNDGNTYSEIGRIMGVSRQRAQQLVALPPSELDVVLARSHGRCEMCGKKSGKLDGHHYSYAKAYPDIVVCVSCHKKLDYGVQKKLFDNDSVIREMRTTGKSFLEIGDLLDVSSGSIKEYCDKNGIAKLKIGGGAAYHIPSGSWHCYLRQDGIVTSLGYYKTREEAIAVFNKNARERSGTDAFCKN